MRVSENLLPLVASTDTIMTTLAKARKDELLGILQERFEKNRERHAGMDWDKIQARLEAAPDKLRSLHEMEESGGEPDVVALTGKSGEFIFCDCSAETPKGRRSLCYDRKAWESRKEHKPASSAMEMAAEMGIEILTEEEFLALQEFGPFDNKTSSWLKTPEEIRKQGGAIFGDHRFGRTFIYHNGAESYYAGRAFRGKLRV